ncbi:MAG: hypothetical protein U1E99_01040 [Agitococcus sp.]|nr:hypothetical protein [Agitococcus sp.]
MSHDTRKDEMMVAHICQSLDQHSQQAHEFDDKLQLLAEQAQRQRQQHLQNRQQQQKWWYLGGSLAIAATVTMVIFSPKLIQQSTHSQQTKAVAIHTSVDPQLLEDMDMLMVLGEEQ